MDNHKVDTPDHTPRHTFRVAMLGSFPPQAQGIQDYGREIAEGIGAHVKIHAIGFRSMYPAVFFPGVKAAMDPAKPPPIAPFLTCEHRLTWYNPAGWVLRALTFKADLLHVQWWSLPLWPVMFTFAVAARLRKIPLVVTVHNVMPHEPSRFFAAVTQALCRLADHVVVHSTANARQARTHLGLPPERVSTIPMPLIHSDVVPERKDRARRALHLSDDAPVVLFFGTIRPYKGLSTLIPAFATVLHHFPDAQLVIAGKAWEPWEKYEEELNEHGVTNSVRTFIEYVPEDEVNTLLSAADCFVLPYTHFDAQSAVGSLYLPYGRPIIVSDVGGLPEWVNHDLRFIVPPEDHVALASRITAVLKNLEGTTSWFEAWSREAAVKISPEAVGAQHVALYEKLIQGRTAN